MESFFDEIHPSMWQWEEANETLINNISDQDSPLSILNEPLFPQHDSSFQLDLKQDSTASAVNLTATQTCCAQPKRLNVDSNYEKNICAYVSKKVVLHLLDSKYKNQVKKFCRMAGCSYITAFEYYSQRAKEVFGINHLSMMITPQTQEQIPMKKMFCAFLTWFLRNRYMFYMLKFGKMQEKQKYIEFKNRYLLYIVEIEEKYFKLI